MNKKQILRKIHFGKSPISKERQKRTKNIGQTDEKKVIPHVYFIFSFWLNLAALFSLPVFFLFFLAEFIDDFVYLVIRIGACVTFD